MMSLEKLLAITLPALLIALSGLLNNHFHLTSATQFVLLFAIRSVYMMYIAITNDNEEHKMEDKTAILKSVQCTDKRDFIL